MDRTVRQPNVQQQATQPRTLTPQQTRRQIQREESNLRREDAREISRLPAAQRAARRQELSRTREQRAQQRLQPSQTPAANLRAQPSVQRAARRGGQPRITTQAARQGRFSAPFALRAQANANRQWRGDRTVSRRAWRAGHRAAFVAWYGPVFWPYAYADIFDYTFWPYGYDDGYWAYAYDDFIDGVFWGEAGPPPEYGYEGETGSVPSGSTAAPRYAAVQELCKQPGTGVTAWPFADIEKKVGLTAEQKALLNEVKTSAADAAAGFKASCPRDDIFPLTPTGRLDAMNARLQATLQAVQTVRPALDKFYESLSDEQKERFNELGPKQTSANAEASQAQNVKSCKEPKPGLASLPIEKIEDAVKPTGDQLPRLNTLQDATDKAVGILQAACPEDTPVTPPGRLEMMENRLQAMIDAANTVKPALADFYGSLSNEQKARFNRIGRTLAQNE